MKRILACAAAGLAALTALVALPATQAAADPVPAPPSSTDQKWTLQTTDSFYVAAELDDSGDQTGMLRSRTDLGDPTKHLGSWESFAIMSDDDTSVSPKQFGSAISLRNEANGKYVSVEAHDGANPFMLKADADTITDATRFDLQPLGGGQYALYSKSAGAYVSERRNATGSQLRKLTATASSVGSWETFTLGKFGGTGSADPVPQTAVTATGTHSIVSWNICSNDNQNNGICELYRKPAQDIADQVSTQIATAYPGASKPEAIYFQEICEKDAQPLETDLEHKLGGGWSVRFAPTYVQVKAKGTTSTYDGTVLAQKVCAKDDFSPIRQDRGAFGVALAVHDSNSWYRGYTLTSPDMGDPGDVANGHPGSGFEQRPALCAAMPETGIAYCTAHLSTGEYNVTTKNPDGSTTVTPEGDDRSGVIRGRQTQELAGIVAGYESAGYKVFYGGDMNTVASASAASGLLAPLYTGHHECALSQPGATANPTGAAFGDPTNGGNKIDYIWGPSATPGTPEPTYTCEVPKHATDPALTDLSDHWMIHATVTF